MKIKDIRMLRLYGPREHGVGGEKAKIYKVIVRIDAENGQYGLGECDHFMGVQEGIAYMKEYFLGRSIFTVNAIVSEMLYGTAAPHPSDARHGVMPGAINAVNACSPTAAPYGPVVWAASGVAIALADLMGKMLGTPAYNLLGGKFREAARVYLDRSSPENSTELAAWREMAAETVESGFQQMKFDIDFLATDQVSDVWNRSLNLAQINRIVERLNTVREAAGKDFEICVDCHMQYNVPDVIRLVKALEPLNLFWIEDPTPITNPDSCADVRANSSIPVCVGEMFIAEQFRLFINREACDILHPDVLFCGGMHELKRIADYAELNHLPVAFHGNGGALATIAAAHVGVASRNFIGLEYHHIETSWLGEYVTRDLPLFRDGCVPLDDAPGLGIELNREVCEQYLAPGESLF